MRAGFISFLLIVVLAGCSSRPGPQAPVTQPPDPSGRYSMMADKAPVSPPDVSKVPDAVPRDEPLSRGGNRSPYEVFGQTYTVLPSAQGYQERGIASWYGMKFHGHLTSNGEVYDMYEMTAAHKSLPIPSYVRVTNLDNGQSVIVRVNDRGPFHQDRLIDLSYAAAYRLDILRRGTGRVQVEAITPNSSGPILAAPTAESPAAQTTIPSLKASHDRRYLQIGAFSSEAAARRVQQQVIPYAAGFAVGIYMASPSGSPIYRVKIGPLNVGEPLDNLIASLVGAGFNTPHLVAAP
jgi:rare lipoprotein A